VGVPADASEQGSRDAQSQHDGVFHPLRSCRESVFEKTPGRHFSKTTAGTMHHAVAPWAAQSPDRVDVSAPSAMPQSPTLSFKSVGMDGLNLAVSASDVRRFLTSGESRYAKDVLPRTA